MGKWVLFFVVLISLTGCWQSDSEREAQRLREIRMDALERLDDTGLSAEERAEALATAALPYIESTTLVSTPVPENYVTVEELERQLANLEIKLPDDLVTQEEMVAFLRSPEFLASISVKQEIDATAVIEQLLANPKFLSAITGPRGERGPTGPPGPQGPEGPQGTQGDAGQSADPIIAIVEGARLDPLVVSPSQLNGETYQDGRLYQDDQRTQDQAASQQAELSFTLRQDYSFGPELGYTYPGFGTEANEVGVIVGYHLQWPSRGFDAGGGGCDMVIVPPGTYLKDFGGIDFGMFGYTVHGDISAGMERLALEWATQQHVDEGCPALDRNYPLRNVWVLGRNGYWSWYNYR